MSVVSSVETGAGAATGTVRTLLRVEGLAALAVVTSIYFVQGGNLWLFALLFLTPDLTFAGFLMGEKAGSVLYNAVHSYVFPAVLAGAGWLFSAEVLIAVALIFTAHIGLDRAAGYGLKYSSSFGHTHLGRIGKAR